MIIYLEVDRERSDFMKEKIEQYNDYTVFRVVRWPSSTDASYNSLSAIYSITGSFWTSGNSMNEGSSTHPHIVAYSQLRKNNEKKDESRGTIEPVCPCPIKSTSSSAFPSPGGYAWV